MTTMFGRCSLSQLSVSSNFAPGKRKKKGEEEPALVLALPNALRILRVAHGESGPLRQVATKAAATLSQMVADAAATAQSPTSLRLTSLGVSEP